MGKKVDVTCCACGKKAEFTVSDTSENQTVHFACGCGAVTELSGPMKGDKAADTLKLLNEVIGKAAPLIQQFRQSKMAGPDTGVGDGMAQVAKEITIELLNVDGELREALKDYVEQSLRMNLLGENPEEEDK
jgi:hypothetical protein